MSSLGVLELGGHEQGSLDHELGIGSASSCLPPARPSGIGPSKSRPAVRPDSAAAGRTHQLYMRLDRQRKLVPALLRFLSELYMSLDRQRKLLAVFNAFNILYMHILTLQIHFQP